MTGRAAELGGDGERRRRGGRRTLAAMGSGGDGKGRGDRRVAKSLQLKNYIGISLARVRVRTQHMERGVSEAGAGLQTLASLRPARASGGGRGRC